MYKLEWGSKLLGPQNGSTNIYQSIPILDTDDASEILHHLDVQNPINTGINYQPQLVIAGFLNHQTIFDPNSGFKLEPKFWAKRRSPLARKFLPSVCPCATKWKNAQSGAISTEDV